MDINNLENIYVIQQQPTTNQLQLPLDTINNLMEMIRKSSENQLQINTSMMGKIEGIAQNFDSLKNDVNELKNKKGENEIDFDTNKATCSKTNDLANQDSVSVLASEGGLDNSPNDSSIEEDMSQTTSVAECDSNPSLPDELRISTQSLLGYPQGGEGGCGTGGRTSLFLQPNDPEWLSFLLMMQYKTNLLTKLTFKLTWWIPGWTM